MNRSRTAYLAALERHCGLAWGSSPTILHWTSGPVHELPEGFAVLRFRPSPMRALWTFATCGMSLEADREPIEAHLFSPEDDVTLVELLTAVAHYHRTGAPLGLGHTVNFGRPWKPGSACDHGLLSLPFLDGPRVEWLELPGCRVRLLWLVPITPAEVELKRLHGLEALEERFEASGFDYADPRRPSVI